MAAGNSGSRLNITEDDSHRLKILMQFYLASFVTHTSSPLKSDKINDFHGKVENLITLMQKSAQQGVQQKLSEIIESVKQNVNPSKQVSQYTQEENYWYRLSEAVKVVGFYDSVNSYPQSAIVPDRVTDLYGNANFGLRSPSSHQFGISHSLNSPGTEKHYQATKPEEHLKKYLLGFEADNANAKSRNLSIHDGSLYPIIRNYTDEMISNLQNIDLLKSEAIKKLSNTLSPLGFLSEISSPFKGFF